MRRQPPTVREMIPAATADMIRRRTVDIIRACMYEENILDAVAVSCYGQGLIDALQVVEHSPELQAIIGVGNPPGYGHGV